MSLALYRKYRPQDFEELVGQSPVRSTLLEALRQNRLSHAYLFSGPRGTGKTSTARLIAKAIQCASRSETGQACGSCSPCEINAKGELIDLIEIDAASNRGIDEIRELRETLHFAPSHSSAKVYIIDEVHMLTKEAFNALLKSLEEPPEHVFFILATTELHKIPDTIRSRCQRYDFKRISLDSIESRLQYIVEQEGLEAEPEALRRIAEASHGGMRDAISMLEQFSSSPLTLASLSERLGLNLDQHVEALYGILQNGSTQEGLDLIDTLHREGSDLQVFAQEVLKRLRRALHEAVAQNQDPQAILNWIELFDRAWLQLKQAVISQLPLEVAVIKACQGQSEGQTVQAVVKELVAKAPAPKPAPKKTEAPKATQPSKAPGLLSLDAFQKNRAKLDSALKSPTLKRSFKTAVFASYEKNILELHFNSSFHLDQVNKAESLPELEAAFKEVFQSTPRFEFKANAEAQPAEPKPDTSAIDNLGWETIDESL